MFKSWLEQISKKSRAERYGDVASSLVIVGLVTILGCAFAYLLHFHMHPVGESEDWGSFGAFLAGVAGTGISFATLVALAFTLGLQAQELAESRALATEQFKVLERQSATMAQQAFDSAFFNLLERFSHVRDSVKVTFEGTGSDGEKARPSVLGFKGHDAFDRMMSHSVFESAALDANSPDRLWVLQTAFKIMYGRYESELGPYFRTLYHIFKFVDSAGQLTTQQKIEYANIARAQLSNVELCVIFYDGLTDLAEKFKPLIERYGILKHVNAEKLLHPHDKANKSLYQRSAFQSQTERETKAEA